MYHPPSKRRQLLQRLTVYSIMTLSIAVLLTVLVFVMLGYQFNKVDGKIEQGGLVQFGSQPAGAAVKIDGSSFGALTPSKTTFASGQHFFSMSLKGYNSWQKSVNIKAGSVVWLNYPRLVPNDLHPSNVADFQSISTSKVSPDKSLIATETTPASPNVQLVDITGDVVKSSDLTIPSQDYTAPKDSAGQSFEITDWDPSSRYLLVKHTYDTSKFEWLIVDTKDISASKNLSVQLDIVATDVKFSNSDSNLVYALSDNDIKKINLADRTVSGPLVQNVADFSLYDRSTITYVSRVSVDTKQRTIGYYTDGARVSRTLRTYSDSGDVPLHVAFGKYYNEQYTAVAYGDTVDILKGSLPSSDSTDTFSQKVISTMTLPGGTQYLSINTGGRFVTAQHGSSYSIYDLELDKMNTTALVSTKIPSHELQWLDGYTLWDDQNGSLRLYEFDGANQHTIMPVVPGFSVAISQNAKYLYGITKDSKGIYHLTRVQMILG
jgi:hypothetical protein